MKLMALREGANIAEEVPTDENGNVSWHKWLKPGEAFRGHLYWVSSSQETCSECRKPLPPVSEWSGPACPACTAKAETSPARAETSPSPFKDAPMRVEHWPTIPAHVRAKLGPQESADRWDDSQDLTDRDR